MTTGERIKQARKKSNMTQKELADKIGTTHQNISQYERDLRNPKIETLQKIADALNVSDDYEPLDIKKEYLHYRRLCEESETQIATLNRALKLMSRTACGEVPGTMPEWDMIGCVPDKNCMKENPCKGSNNQCHECWMRYFIKQAQGQEGKK